RVRTVASALMKAALGLCVTGAACVAGVAAVSAVPKTPTPPCVDKSAVTNVSVTDQNGDVHSLGIFGRVQGIQAGDTVTVHFSVQSTTACPDGVQLTLVSYGTQTADFVLGAPQSLYDVTTQTFAPGSGYTLVVHIPLTSGGSDPSCNPQHDN